MDRWSDRRRAETGHPYGSESHRRCNERVSLAQPKLGLRHHVLVGMHDVAEMLLQVVPLADAQASGFR
jgi:hypothetical protein